jgi:cell division protein FtsQ
MFKKRIWKPILIWLAWLVSLSGVVVLMSFIDVKKAGVICSDVKVYIPGNQYFIDKEEIDNILHLNSTNTLIGRRIASINMHDLENKLKANAFIETAQVYADMDGVVRVEVTQRRPILRIMSQFDKDFYVDEHGLKVPLSNNFTARVLVANGFIEEPFGNKIDTLHTDMGRQVFKTASFISKDTLWNAQIAEIYVNAQHEMELIPRVGNDRILLGNADSLQSKFANLLAFYKQAIPRVGWEAYKLINIKYANQVIGVKKDSTNKDGSVKAASAVKPDSLQNKIQDTSHIKN